MTTITNNTILVSIDCCKCGQYISSISVSKELWEKRQKAELGIDTVKCSKCSRENLKCANCNQNKL